MTQTCSHNTNMIIKYRHNCGDAKSNQNGFNLLLVEEIFSRSFDRSFHYHSSLEDRRIEENIKSAPVSVHKLTKLITNMQ